MKIIAAILRLSSCAFGQDKAAIAAAEAACGPREASFEVTVVRLKGYTRRTTKIENFGLMDHRVAPLAAEPFLTTSLQAEENNRILPRCLFSKPLIVSRLTADDCRPEIPVSADPAPALRPNPICAV
jgi:hypothetical protein